MVADGPLEDVQTTGHSYKLATSAWCSLKACFSDAHVIFESKYGVDF